MFILLCSASVCFSQSDSLTVSDDDLQRYMVTMDSVNHMKEALLREITAMVKHQPDMTNARYNTLSKIVDNPEQLKEAKATPQEIAFIKSVQARKEAGTAAITETFQAMAKDYVGATIYNRIKQGLATDETLKARYAALMAARDNKGSE